MGWMAEAKIVLKVQSELGGKKQKPNTSGKFYSWTLQEWPKSLLVQHLNINFLQYADNTSKALLHPSCSWKLLRVGMGLRDWVNVAPSIIWMWQRHFDEAEKAERDHHDTLWQDIETISCQLGPTYIRHWHILKYVGMLYEYISNNNHLIWFKTDEMHQSVSQSMGLSCEIWQRCFVRDQKSQAAPNFLLSLPVAAD